MTESIIALIPIFIVLIRCIFKAITNHDNNKTRIEMYKLSIKAGHKQGVIGNNYTKFSE